MGNVTKEIRRFSTMT